MPRFAAPTLAARRFSIPFGFGSGRTIDGPYHLPVRRTRSGASRSDNAASRRIRRGHAVEALLKVDCEKAASGHDHGVGRANRSGLASRAGTLDSAPSGEASSVFKTKNSLPSKIIALGP